MELSVSIDKDLYDKVNCIAVNNKKEQMMIFGGKVTGDKIKIDSESIKWFTFEELNYQDDEIVNVDEGMLIDAIMGLNKRGFDSAVVLRSHPCAKASDDFLYGSLSETDIVNSKKLLLICQFMNVRYFDGVATGKNIYFWSIDNEKMLPVQMNCYVGDELVKNRVPGSIKELVNIINENKGE